MLTLMKVGSLGNSTRLLVVTLIKSPIPLPSSNPVMARLSPKRIELCVPLTFPTWPHWQVPMLPSPPGGSSFSLHLWVGTTCSLGCQPLISGYLWEESILLEMKSLVTQKSCSLITTASQILPWLEGADNVFINKMYQWPSIMLVCCLRPEGLRLWNDNSSPPPPQQFVTYNFNF
jgi:hypothetical protein